jgi:hypothetical protein
MMQDIISTCNTPYLVPVIGCLALTYRLYRIIVPYINRLPDFDLNVNEDIPLYDADETFDYLEELGAINLVENPTIIGLFVGYLAFIGKLTVFLDVNYNILDPGTLEVLLHNLKPLITANELAWHLLRSVWYMLDIYEFNIDYDPEAFEELFRDTNNDLFAVYRAIERAINVDTGIQVQ